MRAFLIGLQFLTRISISRQEVWTEEDFGRSVRYFPLVGAVLGMFYATAAYGLFQFPHRFGVYIPYEFASAILLAMPVLLTGAIHCDGFMDTVDGIFSGRSRERMLEIMKDSR
ncbi:MAG: adenosylcobinamide-GDP ribazoletransferase, partial [Selenomonadales bacterium]|nr:adenosylcobinamide-GDP ribazoletransferase [Selenomonadales bacterium]